MNAKRYCAFIDECGNSDLAIENVGATSHFIVTCILVDEDALNELERNIDIVRKKHFQTGPIKSSYVSDNDDRRIQILQDLCSFDFSIYALVVDKKRLVTEGFRHKQSFIKFLHGQVDRELYRIFPRLSIYADDYGTKEFRDGFREYVHNVHIPDIFNESDFGFVKAKSILLVQVADFIAGTIARCFDTKLSSQNASLFLLSLRKNIIQINEFPPQYKSYIYDSKHVGEAGFDDSIVQASISLAESFIDKNDGSSVISVIDQINCLKYLLFYFRYINPFKCVSTRELLKHLNYNRFSDMREHYFRTKVIGKLRDDGILISSSDNGYKLPANKRDLINYLNHSNVIVSPMMNRIKKCRDQVFLATNRDFDLLEIAEFSNLKQYFNTNS